MSQDVREYTVLVCITKFACVMHYSALNRNVSTLLTWCVAYINNVYAVWRWHYRSTTVRSTATSRDIHILSNFLFFKGKVLPKRFAWCNAKCLHLKKLTCKGTLQQVFIRETGNAVSHVGIFDPTLWTVAPLPFSLVGSPPPSLCE
jgi:hypothetical protein